LRPLTIEKKENTILIRATQKSRKIPKAWRFLKRARLFYALEKENIPISARCARA
jgi:hypothetical protein